MQKTILITGATDGIGLETAKMLVSEGHRVLVHGRNTEKLKQIVTLLSTLSSVENVESYESDLSRLSDVEALAAEIIVNHKHIDVLINNAGVYTTPIAESSEGLDVRFVVNTIAPYLLTRKLLPLMGSTSRVVNVSSAAQSSVDLTSLACKPTLGDGLAYAQSKLAITMWSRDLALSLDENGPAIIAVNPASMLGSKMVKDAYGVTGGDLRIGADILCRAALSVEFEDASGKYYDNDARRFAAPHNDALDPRKTAALVCVIDKILMEKCQ
ncbi:SDR family NAD(P)-dependent oxidoreductase [Vibrio sp. DW001]|uniref:SDR family NAD(P)-dependent oxidoreductase n=1 Tax=Vibrio sp. DW001 TaxID=2912315 RepID=UPI0023AE8C7B|nr:SDR family NAD(P)-dependent oxidoreductase [Vibrio sp. DW001]WED28652.1 SDR family NAD(P)-dependent oxidoreductase [Vibrio sp. DW001]